MSKSSSKQRYEQFKDWLNTRNSSSKSSKKPSTSSRLDYYTERQVK